MVKFKVFSKKQTKVLTWWTQGSPHKDKDCIICDGAIRAGKTVVMALSFMFWSMSTFNGCQFGMSGKTVGSFQRNVLFWLKPALRIRGYKVQNAQDPNVFTVRIKNKTTGEIIKNYYYVFGGRDESSYQFIQGMTAAGWFFDEVAIQPETFVTQAIGRCSVEGAKLWFNCNPDKPSHWFKRDFVDKAKEKGFYHLHFLMEDNPSLSKRTLERYKTRFTGVFYLRYILGLWALAKGVIYDMLVEDNYYVSIDNKTKWKASRYLCLDYGTSNPTAVYNIYDGWKVVYIDDEYYYSSKQHGKQKTDKEIADDIVAFIAREPQPVEAIIMDPSAASLKAELKQRGLRIKNADNDVIGGIRKTSSAFYTKMLLINKQNCPNLVNELGGYIWDEKAHDRGIEQPVKINDHGCDAIRYFVNTILTKRIEGRA